ncbi:MAG TPA: hypothetical protein VK646_07400 [Actinomycetota bacterium]|nr:hypothetical protein [Actinomycetota bacterium]
MTSVLVATDDGLRTFDERGNDVGHELDGHAVGPLLADGPERWAVVDRSQVFHRPDANADWSTLVSLEELQATCLSFTDRLLIGTSSARLLQVVDGAGNFLDGFDAAEGRGDWYTPWGGPPDTRSISEWGRDVYVNVHVGGILRTSDAGASWTPTIDIHADVHRVATAEELVLAACAGGLATSTDRGATWSMRADGLEGGVYLRGVTVCGDSVLVSASEGPRGGRAAIYRGALAAEGGFERCTEGLPEAFDDNVDSLWLDSPPDGSFAAFGTGDGRLFGSDDVGASWSELATGLPPIAAVLVLP